MACALEMRRRAAISAAAKLSAIETTLRGRDQGRGVSPRETITSSDALRATVQEQPSLGTRPNTAQAHRPRQGGALLADLQSCSCSASRQKCAATGQCSPAPPHLQPASTMPRYTTTASTVMGMLMAMAVPARRGYGGRRQEHGLRRSGRAKLLVGQACDSQQLSSRWRRRRPRARSSLDPHMNSEPGQVVCARAPGRKRAEMQDATW